MEKKMRSYVQRMRRSFLLAGLMLIMLLAGCGKEAEEKSSSQEVTTQEATTQEQSTERPALSDRSFPVTEQYVKLTGRTGMNNDIRWLIHSASKVEFKLTGTKASIVLRGDASINDHMSTRARYAVYVDGQRTMTGMVRKMEEELEVFSSEEEKEVEIAIVKLSEAANSIFGIREIHVTASKDIEPLPEKKTKIEFIGDSITCGYGVDDENRDHHFSTETEDATKTYAYMTADALDADYSFVAYSGHGIISGYTDDGTRTTSQMVPDIYEMLGKNYGSANRLIDLSAPWDFSRFVPDHIVINLGTNDSSYVGNEPERKEVFITGYVSFLKMVRKDNPKAHITAALGTMGDSLYPCVEEAVKRYSAETGDTNISTLHFTPQDGSTGYAADWHPTEATQKKAADELIRQIGE